MRIVRLMGELGEKFGRVHKFQVNSPAEAIRALRANFPGFEPHMLSSDQRGVGYKVLVRGEPLNKIDEIHNPSGKAEIAFVPVIMGSGGEQGGALQIFAGALLVIVGTAFAVAGVVASPFTAGASLNLAPLGVSLITTGIGLIFGGVAQIMAAHALNAEGPAEGSPENRPSYVFNGAVNTIAQGHPVPVGYGRMIVGSAVISAGISVEEIPVDS